MQRGRFAQLHLSASDTAGRAPSRYRTCTPVGIVHPTRDRRWLRVALVAACSSTHSAPTGAIAVKGGRMLASAYNRRRSLPAVVGWPHCSFHAEQGLVRLGARLDGSTVYVARVGIDGESAMARPCRWCHTLLSEAGVRRVVWSTGAAVLACEWCV